MTDDEVEIPMQEKDQEGSVEKMTLQSGNRVKIPDTWNETLGIEQGDEIGLYCGRDKIVIFEWSLDNISDIRDEMEDG